MITTENFQNVYAKNTKDETIHISEAKSGRKGYFCMGCGRELQAVKQTKENRISYFRHDHNALKGEGLCAYSDETYRHQLGKQILLNIKRIKVPAVYKYPPKNSEGLIANLISKERYIEASFGKAELTFFEDQNGQIHYENVYEESVERHQLIRPDITFFDNQSKPILLIELVATHKLTDDKKLKIKRLGIDCIQVTIPKDSPESIEKVFDSTKNTKWIYNYEQESREYIPTTIPGGERISFINEEQRKFFEESFKCRVSQIGNLIRTIKRCLESELYAESVGNIKSEISRVEGIADAERDELERLRADHELRIEALRDGIREKVNRRYEDRIESIYCERARLDAEEHQLQEFDRNENSKFSTRIEEHRNRVEAELSNQYPSYFKEEQRRYCELEEEYRNLEERYQRKKTELISETEREERIISETKVDIERIEKTFDTTYGNKREEEGEIEIIERNINEESGREKVYGSEVQSIENQIGRLEKEKLRIKLEMSERFGVARTELEKRFELFRRQFINRVEGRDFEENEYTRRYQDLLDDLVKTNDYILAKRNYRLYEKAWRCFTSGAYKNWPD